MTRGGAGADPHHPAGPARSAAARVRAAAATMAAVAVLAAAGPAPAPGYATAPADDAYWLQKGGAIVAGFRAGLMDALKEGLRKGPAEAIEACRLAAPAIAASAGSPGVHVGRTSHRLRNPANAPKAWMKPLLDDYVAGRGLAGPRVVHLGDGGVGYVEPITVQPMCLTCHGPAVGAGLRERLADLYPEDRATGFAAGDFRGLFWVEFDPPGYAVGGR
jgi:hypothetical protein